MQTEVGGRINEFLNAPETYHYGLNKDGKRIAGHTGKVSTAFGPFGILESTAKDPGYGVKPLQNKSLEEQIRFASEYLAARSKRAGGLAQGLAGYGEGDKYSAKVLGQSPKSLLAKGFNLIRNGINKVKTYQQDAQELNQFNKNTSELPPPPQYQDTPLPQSTFNPDRANQWAEFKDRYNQHQRKLAESAALSESVASQSFQLLQNQLAGIGQGSQAMLGQMQSNANGLAPWGQGNTQQKKGLWGWV